MIFRIGRLLPGGAKGPGKCKYISSDLSMILWTVLLRDIFHSSLHRVLPASGPAHHHPRCAAPGGEPGARRRPQVQCRCMCRCWRRTAWRSRWTRWSTTESATPPSAWPTWRTPTPAPGQQRTCLQRTYHKYLYSSMFKSIKILGNLSTVP